MAAYWHFVIMLIGGVETMWLGSLHARNLIKWEPIWVVFVCWLQYMVDLAVPEAQWIKPEIANGEHVDWLRACGWMTTSPVLIIILVSMTTFGGREASVRVVPFLVANQVMFLAGLTSAICVAPARWYAYSLAVASGLWVFASSAMCFRSLYVFFGDQNGNSDGRTLVLVLGLTYFVGCAVGPLAWTCGHSGFDQCSDTITSAAYLAGDLLSKNLFVVLAVVLKVRYLSDTPRTISTLVPGLNTGGKIKNTIRLMKQPPGRQSAPELNSSLNSSYTKRRAAEAHERSIASSRRRRPSIGNIAIDNTVEGWATQDGLLTTRQINPTPPGSREVSFGSQRPSREVSFGSPSGSCSPEMGQRALRDQSGFQFQVLGAPPMQPQSYPAQSYQPPNQAYAPMGAPASTVQAHAMQAVLQRVQELVTAHANVPSNAAHWSAVLETASGERQARQARVDEYELELASSMSKLAQARAEVLQLAATEKDREGEARPSLRGGDDAEEHPAATVAPSSTMSNSAYLGGPLASPRKAQSAWLQASLQSDEVEEENTSTPVSPLLDPPTAQTLFDPRGGDLRVGLPPRPQFGTPERPHSALGRRHPPVEYAPRVLEEARRSDPRATRRTNDPMQT